MNTKSTASCGCGKPRTTPISPEEKRWLKEKLYQSQYDEFMQERREAWLFLRLGHKLSSQASPFVPKRQLVRAHP